MKWNGFIMGGIIGAATAVYMSQKKPQMMKWVADAAVQSWSSLNSKQQKMGAQWSSQQGQAQPQQQAAGNHQASAGTAHSHKAPGQTWDTLEDLMAKDPEAKKEAAKIIADAMH